MNDTAYLVALVRKSVDLVPFEVSFDVFSEERPTTMNTYGTKSILATVHKIKAADYEEACLLMADYVTSTHPWLWKHLGRFSASVTAIRRRRRGEAQFVPGRRPT